MRSVPPALPGPGPGAGRDGPADRPRAGAAAGPADPRAPPATPTAAIRAAVSPPRPSCGELAGLLAAPLVLDDGVEPAATASGSTVRRTVPWPTPAEALELWRAALGGLDDRGGSADRAATTLAAAVTEVAQHYRLGAGVGRRASRRESCAARPDAGRGPAADGHDLAPAVPARGRVEPRRPGRSHRGAGRRGTTWSCPPGQIELLHDIARQVRHRHRVYERLGLRRADRAAGLGVTALFAGESGTGKTLAAEVLAADLELDLYRIDLSATVSKYIGETEKNLRRLFDAAETSGAVLLFDEADALFGKRGEVKAGPRPLRQPRGRLPAAAHGVLPGPRPADHEPAGERRPGVPAPPAVRACSSRSPTRRSGRASGRACSRPARRPRGSTPPRLARLAVPGRLDPGDRAVGRVRRRRRRHPHHARARRAGGRRSSTPRPTGRSPTPRRAALR